MANLYDSEKSMSQNSPVLVVFGKELPRRSKKWWGQINTVVGPKSLKEEIEKDRGLFFVDIEELVDAGSVQEACQLVDKLSRITLSDGRSIQKLVNYQGYELWWIYYDNLYDKFCLPHTQYRRLLQYLKDFKKVYLYKVPYLGPFQYFLNVYGCQCIFLKKPKIPLLKIFPLPSGILVQVILSLPFLLWLKITRPKLMVWTSDLFDPPHDYDFRMRFIYEELRKRKIPFVEFIRSSESLPVVLRHALRRKRPVVYSTAIIIFLHHLAKFFIKKGTKELINSCLSLKMEPEQRFWFLVATHHLRNVNGTVWSIRVMKFILQWIGVKAAIIIVGSSRNFHEILACKLAGIKTIGIQHAATPRYCAVHEFMPNFDGKFPITLDMYGLWSDWWREYYLSHGRAFRPEQLYVSGHMRPLKEKKPVREDDFKQKKWPLKVLFISEQLAIPKEIMPYILTLLETKDFELYFKFRPYRDGFELWLKENQPTVYKKILEKTKILRGTMEEATHHCDVVVGSHSTAVLEALLQLKPFVFFRTGKWGDYFEIKSFNTQCRFFAKNPQELVNCVKKSVYIPKEDLKQLQERFFGNPHQNGSKWVVEQALEFAKNYGKQ